MLRGHFQLGESIKSEHIEHQEKCFEGCYASFYTLAPPLCCVINVLMGAIFPLPHSIGNIRLLVRIKPKLALSPCQSGVIVIVIITLQTVFSFSGGNYI